MADTDIQTRFSPHKPLEQDVLYEIQSIVRLHDLSVDDLFFKWDAYCIRMDLDAQSALSLQNIRNLKHSIQDELEKSHRATQVRGERRVNAAPRGVSGGDVFGMLDGLVPSTPALASRAANRGSGSELKRKMGGLKVNSSPAGISDQLKAMNGLPYVFVISGTLDSITLDSLRRQRVVNKEANFIEIPFLGVIITGHRHLLIVRIREMLSRFSMDISLRLRHPWHRFQSRELN